MTNEELIKEEEKGIEKVQEEVETKEYAKVESDEKGNKSVKLGNPRYKLELRDGETDFRNINKCEEKQLNVRYETMKIQALNNMMLCLCDMEVILIKMAEKMGISKEEIDNELSK